MILTKQKTKTIDGSKRLFNVLEIKVYDILQNIEIIASRLSNNQIKDSISQFYCIFGQLKPIYEQGQVEYLYDINKKILTSIMFVISLLTQRLQKHSHEKVSKGQTQKQIKELTQEEKVQQTIKESIKSKISKLGGINLYNQTYLRGIEYQEITNLKQLQSFPNEKLHGKLLQKPKTKEQLLEDIRKQIQNKTDVEIQNEEIKKHIDRYRQSSKVESFISNQNQLIEIIDFFKVTEISAINFLHKSPNNNNQYTENYLNRLEDLEKDIKSKQNNEKTTIIDKMKIFMINLKNRMVEIQKNHQSKKSKIKKLSEYEKTLKKDMISEGTQTSLINQNKTKEYQAIVRQLQQRYKILTQIKNSEFNYETRYYMIEQQINIKIKEIQKLKTNNDELKQEIQQLKKVIRDDRQKGGPDRRMQKLHSNKYSTSSRHHVDDTKRDHQDERQQLLVSKQAEQLEKERQNRLQKKLKKLGNRNRASIESNFASEFNKAGIEKHYLQILENNNEKNYDHGYKLSRKEINNLKTNQEETHAFNLSEDPKYPEGYINDKKSTKKNNDEERQVSFQNSNDQGLNERKETLKTNFQVIEQNSREHIASNVSMRFKMPNSSELDDDIIQRRSTKNRSLKPKVGSQYQSNLSIDLNEHKISSKGISKKCVILKDNKEKNKIMTILKLQYKQIYNQVIDIIIKPSGSNQKQRPLRPSQPFPLNQQNNSNLTKIKEDNTSYIRSQKKLKKLNKIPSISQNTKNTLGKKEIKDKMKKMNSNDRSIKESQKDLKNPDFNADYSRSIKEQKEFLTKKKEQNKNFANTTTNSYQSNKIQNSQNNLYVSKKSFKELKSIKQTSENKPKAARCSILNQKNNDSKTINTIKLLKKNLQKINKLQQSSWKTQTISNASSQEKLIQYIHNQLKKEDLNISEFNQIINVLEDQYDTLSNPLQKQNEHSWQRKDSIKKQLSNTFNQDSRIMEKEAFNNKTNQIMNEKQKFHHTQAEKMFMKPVNKSSLDKIHKQLNRSMEKVDQSRQYYDISLNISSINKIKKMHFSYSKCKPHDNSEHICQHLQKYFNLFKKIKEMHEDERECLKMHIEKVGILQFMTPEMRQNEKKLDKSQKHVTQVHENQNFKQKERILPIINATASLFYKGKSKLKDGK